MIDANTGEVLIKAGPQVHQPVLGELDFDDRPLGTAPGHATPKVNERIRGG